MKTLTIKILHERAMDVIRYMQHVKDVKVVEKEEETLPTSSPRDTWAGAISQPSQELLDYAEKVRKEWNERI